MGMTEACWSDVALVDETPDLETDPRFPSGPWTGFYLQPSYPGRFWMELSLRFQHGSMQGEGRDPVGKFVIRGRYDLADGKCHWSKRYLGMHDVFYQGFNEGKGIWGTWEIKFQGRGGFHIWPKGMPDPTGQTLSAAADPPVEEKTEVKEEELVGAPP
jgi:hypothetical protein